MDRLSLLEFLDIPQAKLINERLTEEESVPKALQLLVAAGLPQQMAQEIYGFIMQDQFAPKPTGGTTPQAGGYSEGMTNANNQMAELREG